MKINFIADFFADQILGGGELNNEVLIDMLMSDGHKVNKLNSHDVTREFIENNKSDCFIVANFINLSKECITALYDKKYIIYEHDHKYLNNRDPGQFADFIAPKEMLVNIGFYKKAVAVLCQSQFHLDIVNKNLKNVNLVNLSGNLWSDSSLSCMQEIAGMAKKEMYAVMDSPIEHKGTPDAIAYCEFKKYPYTLIKNDSYEDFLSMLGQNSKFVFFPKTPETLSRVVVEARMMGMGVISNKMIGATKEEWYKMKGIDLIDVIRSKRYTIKDTVLGLLS
jgi:hypothetical protein